MTFFLNFFLHFLKLSHPSVYLISETFSKYFLVLSTLLYRSSDAGLKPDFLILWYIGKGIYDFKVI